MSPTSFYYVISFNILPSFHGFTIPKDILKSKCIVFTFENLLFFRVGAFFFIVMNQIFGNLSAVELFIKERKIFV